MPVIFAPLKILDEIASDIYASSKKVIGLTKDAFVRNLEIGMSSYLRTKYERYSKVHTLLSPNEPIDVDDIYVNPKFDHMSHTVHGDQFVDFVSERNVVVVQAIAGHGKSMFVRELFCRLCKVNHGLIPILLELRDIDFDSTGIIEAAHHELSGKSTHFSKPAFEALVRSGKILFLLDGFDEIKGNVRKLALKKIDQLTRDLPSAKVIITSRPTDIFNGWGPATIVFIEDYDLAQIIELIERTPIKPEIRDAFRTKVEQEYIKTHVTFLANPLLCNMMVLTFMRGGDIPKQRHIFYRKAFDTLFKHHDDMKFLYKRDYHSDLPEDVFVRLWKSFCYFSYIEREFGFDNRSIRKFISRAADYLSVSVDSQAIADDFVESLCIVVKDGDDYSFLHRSFQEYGAATFLCTERAGNLADILARLNKHFTDDVLDIVFLSNQELIEQEYILPRIEALIRSYGSRRSVKSKAKLFYPGLSIQQNLDGEELVYFAFGESEEQDGDDRSANAYLLAFVRRSYQYSLDPKLSANLVSWMRKLRREARGKKGKRYEVFFQSFTEEALELSPVKELIAGYHKILVEVRAEIVKRRKHQRQMLMI